MRPRENAFDAVRLPPVFDYEHQHRVDYRMRDAAARVLRVRAVHHPKHREPLETDEAQTNALTSSPIAEQASMLEYFTDGDAGFSELLRWHMPGRRVTLRRSIQRWCNAVDDYRRRQDRSATMSATRHAPLYEVTLVSETAS